MTILNTEVDINIYDTSAKEFRNCIVSELRKCVKEPFAMNSESEMKQVGEQKCLKEIIDYLNYVI